MAGNAVLIILLYVCMCNSKFIMYNTITNAHQKGHACTEHTAVTSQLQVHY